MPKLMPPVQPDVRILRGGTSGKPCARRTSASRSSVHTRSISRSSRLSIRPSRYRKPTTSGFNCHGEHMSVTSSRPSTRIENRISPMTPASTASDWSPTKRTYCRGTTGVRASGPDSTESSSIGLRQLLDPLVLGYGELNAEARPTGLVIAPLDRHDVQVQTRDLVQRQ